MNCASPPPTIRVPISCWRICICWRAIRTPLRTRSGIWIRGRFSPGPLARATNPRASGFHKCRLRAPKRAALGRCAIIPVSQMERLILELAQHGYLAMCAAAFLEAVGLPIPASLAFLAAGGASARGPLNFWACWSFALASMASGDALLYILGRLSGWWLLGLLCRLSLNPESCIMRAANSFYKRGRSLLLFAKFLPGVNTMAAPLAGSMNMPFRHFIFLDLAGTAIYTGVYLSVGYVFSHAIESVMHSYHLLGVVLTWVFAGVVAIYLAVQGRMWLKSRKQPKPPLLKPAEVARLMSLNGGVIYDVRSHGYYDPKTVRISGSKRLEPSAIERLKAEIPKDLPIYLYCTCYREATSTQIAVQLMEIGMEPSVIEGGLKAWRRAGLPVEKAPPEEMAQLPVFQS